MKKLMMMSCFVITAYSWISMAYAEVPLPKDISISVPSSDLKKEISAFSGKWVGNWSGNLDAILIVEQIGPEIAKVIYAWGDAPRWNISAGYQRYDAKVAKGDGAEIEFRSQFGASFFVKMGSDLSTIRVTRTASRGTLIETFKRVAQ